VNTQSRNLIKFKHGDLEYLRGRLLEDLSKEHFAVLLGKTRKIDGCTIINIVDLLFPAQADYNTQNVAFLRIKKDFIHAALAEVTSRYDVDTIIDVHTHPFSQGRVAFSATEMGMSRRSFSF
jgi:molybdopterin-synthase adenylyltransferase